VELNTEMVDGKRYYVHPDGSKFKSVTTILGERTDKSALYAWRKRVGEEEANKISVQAATRGTAVHLLCERYLRNEEDYLKGAMPSNVMSFNDLQKILDDNIDLIYANEIPLFSHRLKAAGRCDLIAKFNGINSIVDFKTSKKPKKEEWIQNYFLQATAYSLMAEEMYDIEIPQIVIMITVDHENPQTFIKNKNDYIEKVLEIFY
jgi:genome maintenance exonuclease 1